MRSRAPTPYVEYAGPALASRTRYHWAVRTNATGWSAPSWFETAYLSPSEWKGNWISGPARTLMPLTNAQASADDACCIQGNATLFSAASAGDRVLRVSSVAGFAQGQSVILGDGAETVTLESVGTAPGNTTTVLAAAAGDTNLKVASVNNFAAGAPLTIGSPDGDDHRPSAPPRAPPPRCSRPPRRVTPTSRSTSVNGFVAGQPALIDGEVRTVQTVGTQGRATTLAEAAAAGATNVKVASVNGFGVGDTLLLGTDSRTITAVGSAGATGTGVTLSSGAHRRRRERRRRAHARHRHHALRAARRRPRAGRRHARPRHGHRLHTRAQRPASRRTPRSPRPAAASP